MIISPKYWNKIGEPIDLLEVELIIINILEKIGCRNLALSGGVDSTLMLSLMVKVFDVCEIRCFNIAASSEHPDYVYSEMAAKYFGVDLEHWIPYRILKKEDDFPGDEIIRSFYNNLKDRKIKSIIACDGIDEFNAGYYSHMKNPTEETYYDFIRKLQVEHLIPLNKNSGEVIVYLPFIFNQVILCWSQIPLFEKVDELNRKKIVCELARRNMVPKEIIERRKYGFCDAMTIKDNLYES